MSQTANVWLDIGEIYYQRDTFFVVQVQCDAAFLDVKAVRLDIDVDPAVLSFDTTKTSVIDTIQVKPGDLFNGPSSEYFFDRYLSGDSTRLTIDMALLSGSLTVDGPGTLAILPITTVGFGESDITLANVFLTDGVGNNIPVEVTPTGSWAKVCQFVGDLNADNRIDIEDLVYFIDWSLRYPSGPAPIPEVAADLDCSNEIDISDLVYMVDYQFHGGPPPCEQCL